MSQTIEKEKILFIINPVSGTRQKQDLPDMIRSMMNPTLFDVGVVVTRYKGEAPEIIRQKLNEGCRLFVAVGGDGTVNEIARALINTDGILGIIPIGSGNGLARHLQIPLQPGKAIKVINTRNTAAIDYGLINEIPFFCTCGVGFDALIGEKFARCKGRGLSNYVKTTLTEYFRYKPEHYKITIDNEKVINHEAFLITFANGSQYGNNAYIAPVANISDGILDICIMSPFSLFKAPAIGIRLFAKNINRSTSMHYESARDILLERTAEGYVHYDGEPCLMGKNIQISVIPKGLKVIIP